MAKTFLSKRSYSFKKYLSSYYVPVIGETAVNKNRQISLTSWKKKIINQLTK